MESVCSDQKEEADRAVVYVIFGLKNEIMPKVDKEVAALEVRAEVKMNEARHTTATRLHEIEDSVVGVQESQQKMWGAVERMSKQL